MTMQFKFHHFGQLLILTVGAALFGGTHPRVEAQTTPLRPAKTAWTLNEDDANRPVTRPEIPVPANVAARDAGNDSDAIVTWTSSGTEITDFVVQRQRSVAGRWIDFGRLRLIGPQLTLRDTPGLGSFRYQVAASNSTGMSAFGDWATVEVRRSWTVFTPSSDTRIIYVSSSEGSDTNNGLSEARPIATLEKARSLARAGFPDWVLLKRGDTWNTPLGTASWSRSGRSASEMHVVSTYGTGPRPVISPPAGADAIVIAAANVSNIAFVGLHLKANAAGGGQGIRITCGGTNLLIEDLVVEGFKDNINLIGSITDARIRRCIIIDAWSPNGAHSQGIYADRIQGLTIEDCVFDHNGWKEGVQSPTQFNHNFYIYGTCTNVTIRNCIVARGSSNGISTNASGLLERNLLYENALAIFMRTAPCTARNNVILKGRDIGPTMPRSIGISVGPRWPEPPLPPSGPAAIEGNLIANKSGLGMQPAIIITSNNADTNTTVNVRGNAVYNWPAESLLRIENPNTTSWDTVRIESNTFADPNTLTKAVAHRPAAFDGTRFTYAGNKYFVGSASASWFLIGTRTLSFQDWLTASGELNATNTPVTFPDPSRTLGSYNATLGGVATDEAFIESVRSRGIKEWDVARTAESVNAYIRIGFGLSPY